MTFVNFDDITDFAALLSGTQMAAQKYLYDEENRLIAVTTTDDEPVLEICYDAVGRRVLTINYDASGDPCMSDPPRWTRHVYSGIQVVAEYEACGWDAGQPETGWELAREFVWGDRFPEPLVLIDYTDAGAVAAPDPEILHYVRDPLGNVVGLTDLGDPEAEPAVPGKLVERYVYDAYGKTYVEVWNAGMSQWDRVEGGASKYGNPFMWTGQRFDPGAKLYHFLFRSYSQELGRWLQRNPVRYRNSLNLYEYVSSAPLYFTDPFGLWQWWEGWGETLTVFLQLPTDDDDLQAAQDEVATYVDKTTDDRQQYLDHLGNIPGVGAVADATNAALDAAQGDWEGAALNALGALPGGDSRKKGGKLVCSVGPPSPANLPPPKPYKNPSTGTPNSTSTVKNPDSTPKQVREYGPDGKPKTDVDYGHGHEKGADGRPVGTSHAHDWTPNPDRDMPDRGPPRPVSPSDPAP